MKKITVIILAAVTLLFSCGKNAAQNYERADSYDVADAGYKQMAAEISEQKYSSDKNKNALLIAGRKLIKTGHIRFASENIAQTRRTVDTLLTKYSAYISRENETSSNYSEHHDLTVRIPKENFDAFLNDLTQNIKKIDEKHIDVQDVTEEFIDIAAALKIKKETEAGYLKLLNRANTIKDILDIQNQIQILRSEIESIEGRLKYLEDAVNFSTLNISVYQLSDVKKDAPSFFKTAFKALKGGIKIFERLLIGLLYGWVFILIAAAGIILFIHIRKKRSKNGK